MPTDNKVDAFLSQYDEFVDQKGLKLREILLILLPGIIEQLDEKAGMIAYCYGQRYVEMICSIIPFRKGLKLAFYKGVELPDPEGLLEGTGKISRYINITSDKQINPTAIEQLIENALEAYKERVKK